MVASTVVGATDLQVLSMILMIFFYILKCVLYYLIFTFLLSVKYPGYARSKIYLVECSMARKQNFIYIFICMFL